MTETNGTDRTKKVEQCLTEATLQRQKTLDKIKEMQKEFDGIVKKEMRRPREKLSELDERLKKLERDRTIVSIPLKQEKEILWQMSRVEKLKRQVEEYEIFDTTVKEKKTELSNLRDELQKVAERVSELRIELAMQRKADQLGCTVEELLGMKLDFPEEKLGMLIGKKGQNVKQLQQKENVSIDVARKGGALHIIGSLQSIDSTALTIDRVLAVEEQKFELPGALVSFLTSKGITVLAEIRARNPDVDMEISRTGECRIKGVPDDILSAKRDLSSVPIVEERLNVPASESAVIVGKQGATINDLVTRHQAAIEVSRGEGESTNKATIVVRGSVSSVKDAIEEIEDLLAQHKEETRNVPIDPIVKDLLLTNKGAGMQALHKLVNEGCREIILGNVNISIDQGDIKVKGKAIVIERAVEIVTDEVRLKEASIVRLPIHPAAIPALIGKGGTGIQKLKEGHENVVLDVNRAQGQISVVSLDMPESTEKVVQAVKEFLKDNNVKTVELDPQLFQSQFRYLLRSNYWKEISELASVSRDDEMFQILLRGSDENIDKALELLKKFLEEHFQDELSVSQNDIGALLRGGKDSKIEEFAKAHNVKLHSDNDKLVVTITGKPGDVSAAKTALDCFLNGGEGVKVVKMIVDDSSVGSLVGKGGSTKAAIEAKFPGVSISILADQTVTIRGPEVEVTKCQKHIFKLLTVSYITEKEVLDEAMLKLSKSSEFRGHLKHIPVQATFEESQVTLRGSRPDVYHTIGLLKTAPGHVYENRIFLETSCFRTFDNASRDSHMSRIQNATRTKITVDSLTSSIVLAGKKENVVTAKSQLFQFLGFLLSEKFSFKPLPGRAEQVMGQPLQLGAVAENSGVFAYVDRDVGGLVITSPDASSVKKAREEVNGIVASLDSSVYKLDLGIDAEWLVPRLIGKNGARIRTLRKTLECTVEIDDNSVTLVSVDPEKLEKGRKGLDDVIAEERSQCFIIELSEENMAAFMGHKGSKIREFEKQHDVKAQAMRKHKGVLRVTGDEENIPKAKSAIEDWIKSQEESAKHRVVYNFDSSEGFLLRRIIGKGGNRINALREQCMCQIDVDVDKLVLKIICDDEDRREAAKKIVEEALDEERSQNAILPISRRDLPAFIGTKGSNVREFEKLHGVKVQVLKTDGGILHISGETDAVAKATEAFNEWKNRDDKASPSNDEGLGQGIDGVVNLPEPVSSNNDHQNSNSGKNLNKQEKTPRKSMQAPQANDFPALSNSGSGEKMNGHREMSPSENSNPANSWASILQNPSKESASYSTADDATGDGEASIATASSGQPTSDEVPGKE